MKCTIRRICYLHTGASGVVSLILRWVTGVEHSMNWKLSNRYIPPSFQKSPKEFWWPAAKMGFRCALMKTFAHVCSAHIILKITTSKSFRTLLMDSGNHYRITLERFAMVTPEAKLSGSVHLCKGFSRIDWTKLRQPAKWGSRNTPWTPKSRIYGKLEQGS